MKESITMTQYCLVIAHADENFHPTTRPCAVLSTTLTPESIRLDRAKNLHTVISHLRPDLEEIRVFDLKGAIDMYGVTIYAPQKKHANIEAEHFLIHIKPIINLSI